MGDPRELEWAKKPDALKEGWTARTGTHMYMEFPLQEDPRIWKSIWELLRYDRGMVRV
jgi:hypothetical protein